MNGWVDLSGWLDTDMVLPVYSVVIYPVSSTLYLSDQESNPQRIDICATKPLFTYFLAVSNIGIVNGKVHVFFVCSHILQLWHLFSFVTKWKPVAYLLAYAYLYIRCIHFSYNCEMFLVLGRDASQVVCHTANKFRMDQTRATSSWFIWICILRASFLTHFVILLCVHVQMPVKRLNFSIVSHCC